MGNVKKECPHPVEQAYTRKDGIVMCAHQRNDNDLSKDHVRPGGAEQYEIDLEISWEKFKEWKRTWKSD